LQIARADGPAGDDERCEMTTEKRPTDAPADAPQTVDDGASDASADEDTEGQSLHNYELVRAVTRERADESARYARDAARAREVKDAKRNRR
jgi:hypothetical protein